MESSEQRDLGAADECDPGSEKADKEAVGGHVPTTLVQLNQKRFSGYGNLGGLRCQRGHLCRKFTPVDTYGWALIDSYARNVAAPSPSLLGALCSHFGAAATLRAVVNYYWNNPD